MIRSVAIAAGVLIGSAELLAAQGVGSVSGTVRDAAGVPLAGAQVILDNKSATTTAQGSFRFDSLRVGTYLITIRLIGYAPLRHLIGVGSGASHGNYVLFPAGQILPTLYAEARRVGIYGTVADTSLMPLVGVKVQLAGRGGDATVTDTGGRFAFPGAIQGQYLARTVYPGYSEERVFFEVKKGEGVELAIRLHRSREIPRREDDVAVRNLGRRLVYNLPQDRLNASQLERYGALGLCDVNRINTRVREAEYPDSLVIILNGTFVLEGRSPRDLCSWQASEVELVEFGDDICRDVTRTLVDLMNVWCSKVRRKAGDLHSPPPWKLPGVGGRIKAQRTPMPFVVIWERR